MFHYTSCGLSSVWLVNGYEERETSHGKAVAISDLDDLHHAIERRLISLVNDRPELSDIEWRFMHQEKDGICYWETTQPKIE